jgi:hypothetical protein
VDGRVPRAEVLGGHLQAEQLADVLVDVGCLQGDPQPTLLGAQEPLLGLAPLGEPLDDLAELRVLEADVVLHPGLAHEGEDTGAVAPAHVPSLERGEAVAPVLLGVAVRAEPEAAQVDQPDGRGERAVAVDAGGAGEVEVGAEPAADVGEPGGHLDHPVELRLVPLRPPHRVVQVLPPAGVVGAHGLQVRVRVRRDPDVAPRGRDDQRLDALDLRLPERAAVHVEVTEPATVAHPLPSRVAGGDGAQPWHPLAPPTGPALTGIPAAPAPETGTGTCRGARAVGPGPSASPRVR